MEDQRQFLMLGAITIAVLLVIIALIVVGDSRGQGSEEVTENVKQEESGPRELPSFELADYNGKTFDEKDFRGKIMVINFWATWCLFCKNELPEFVKLKEAFPDDVAIIAINRAEPKPVAQSFSDSLAVDESILFLLDPQDSYYKAIGGFSMPETLFVNTKKEIATHKRGPLTFEQMEEIVSAMLKK